MSERRRGSRKLGPRPAFWPVPPPSERRRQRSHPCARGSDGSPRGALALLSSPARTGWGRAGSGPQDSVALGPWQGQEQAEEMSLGPAANHCGGTGAAYDGLEGREGSMNTRSHTRTCAPWLEQTRRWLAGRMSLSCVHTHAHAHTCALTRAPPKPRARNSIPESSGGWDAHPALRQTSCATPGPPPASSGPLLHPRRDGKVG